MTLSVEASGRPPAADLLLVVASVAAAVSVAFTPVGTWRPLAIVVGIPFVLLTPGYALVSAVFPRAGETAPAPDRGSSLSRLVLSVAGSVVAVAVVGVALDFTVWGFQREAVVAGLAAVALGGTAVAYVRRRRVGPETSAGVTAGAVRARVRTVVAGGGPTNAFLTLLVVAAAVGAVGVVAEDAGQSGSVTEFYVLGEDESGRLVAGSYPTNLTAGEPVTVGIGVGTTREAGFDGTVTASLERVAVSDEATRVTERESLGSFEVRVAAGNRTVRRHTVTPTMTGDRLRLTYRLSERGSDSVFRRVQVWVSVSDRR